MAETVDKPQLQCPLPFATERIVLAHGGGGWRMIELIERVFAPAFFPDRQGEAQAGEAGQMVLRHDSAVLPAGALRLAFTTDSYVVRPRQFPGGDIGKLAVFGTVNDLAMAGARPLWLSGAFVLEEGLSIIELQEICESMRDAAEVAGVRIVTGDTKVVERGKGDGLYINTSGVGIVPPGVEVHPGRIRDGDAVLLTGDVGRHGIAVLSAREGLGFEGTITSDCAPLNGLVSRLLDAGVSVHCLRDLTRGGLATALNELAREAGVGFEIQEDKIPVSEAVAGACELLGLDPVYVACEGRMVAIVPAGEMDQALTILRADPLGAEAQWIGQVTGTPRQVVLRTCVGSRRPLDLLSGEQLPRIC